MKKAGAARAEREPHHAAARRRRRRRRGDAHACSSRISTRRSAWRSSATIFYVANTDAIVRFPYTPGATRITRARHEGRRPARRAASTITGRRTSSRARDGTKLYVTVGSNSNVGENGIDEEKARAAIWEIDRATGQHRVFASGLRNPIGMAWEPRAGALWTVGQRARRAGQRSRARLHDVGARRRLLRLAVQLLRRARRRRASSRSAPISSRRRSCPTTRSARTRVARPRVLGGAALPARSATACSSASTARGIASRAAATR